MTISVPETKSIKPDGTLFLWLLAFICLIPWAIIQSQASINSNTAWLTLCAERIIDGGSMSQDCYDTNPPLSVLIHTPPILLEKITGIASYYWIFILSLSIALAGSFLTQYFLNKLKWVEPHQSTLLAITIFAMLTIYTRYSFSDRDHLIAMIFLPFTLCQICISQQIHIHKFSKYFTLILGTILILLKPYYGLLPALILLHRIYKNRSLNALIKPDFIILSFTTICYISITLIYFSDYVFSIAPDVFKLYSPYTQFEFIWPECKIILITLILCCVSYFIFIEHKNYSLILLLSFCALNGLLAFVLQLKGFFYHLLPAHTALAALIMLLMLGLIQSFSSEKIAKHLLTNCGCVLILFSLLYIQKPPNSLYLTHQQYENNVLTQTLEKYCDKNCSYFITYDNMDIVSQLAYYYPAQYASRFPTFWFCPMIDEKLEKNDNIQETEYYRALQRKYYTYVAEDINRFTPSVLILIESDNDAFHSKQSRNDIIESFMKDYTKLDTLEIDRALFYRKTKYDFPYPIKWEVYLRKNAQYFERLEK